MYITNGRVFGGTPSILIFGLFLDNLSISEQTNRRRSSEPSYHPIFGQIFDFEIFNYFDSGHSAQHIVKLSVSKLV